MPSFAIERFLDATISPAGDCISVRFATDTEQVVVLDFPTGSLEMTVLPVVAALARAREKSGDEKPAEAPEMFLPLRLASSNGWPAAKDMVVELRLDPGSLPLRFALAPDAARKLLRVVRGGAEDAA